MTFEGKLYAAMAVAAVGACVALLWRHREGVEVGVRNDEAHIVRDVAVVTTAGAYPLGDFAPGATASTLVGCAGESSVSLEWLDAHGARQRCDADVYIEGGADGTRCYGGTVDFVMTGGTARSEEDVRFVFGFLSRADAPPAQPRDRSR